MKGNINDKFIKKLLKEKKIKIKNDNKLQKKSAGCGGGCDGGCGGGCL